MESLLLDLGGTYFKGSPLPIFTNGLDANLVLYILQQRYKEFIENRILITNLIQRIGGNVAEIDWYNTLNYVTYLNDLENVNFVGTIKQRYTQAKEQGIDRGLRLSILGDTEEAIYIAVKEDDLEFALEFADNLQVIEQYGIKLPKVKIIAPYGNSDKFVERLLFRESVDIYKGLFVNVVFQLKDKSEFTDFLNTEQGINSLVHWLSRSLDDLSERKLNVEVVE